MCRCSPTPKQAEHGPCGRSRFHPGLVMVSSFTFPAGRHGNVLRSDGSARATGRFTFMSAFLRGARWTLAQVPASAGRLTRRVVPVLTRMHRRRRDRFRASSDRAMKRDRMDPRADRGHHRRCAPRRVLPVYASLRHSWLHEHIRECSPRNGPPGRWHRQPVRISSARLPSTQLVHRDIVRIGAHLHSGRMGRSLAPARSPLDRRTLDTADAAERGRVRQAQQGLMPDLVGVHRCRHGHKRCVRAAGRGVRSPVEPARMGAPVRAEPSRSRARRCLLRGS